MGDWAISTDGVTFTDFDALGYTVAAALGAGMPEQQIVSQPYATQDGSQFQRTRVTERVLILRGRIAGSSRSDFHAKRAALIALIQRDNTDPQSAVTLRYTGGPVTPLYLDCYYRQDLGGGEHHGFYEDLALRFWCADPFWYGASGSGSVSTKTTLASDYVFLRQSLNGYWERLGTGVNNVIHALVFGPDGTLYAGGEFTTADGVSVGYVAKRINGVWSAHGGAFNGIVRALAFASDGVLWAGGSFTSSGGGTRPSRYLAYYDGSSLFRENLSSSGLIGAVYALASDGSGLGSYYQFYIGGTFTATYDGSITLNYASRGTYYQIKNHSSHGNGIGTNGPIYAMATDSSGNVYVGGAFTTAGGLGAVNFARINGPNVEPYSLQWIPYGAFNGTVYAVAVGPDGTVYAGGAFTTVDGVASAYLARRLPGSAAWDSIGTPSGIVRALAVGPDGTLYAGGEFSSIIGATGDVYKLARYTSQRGWEAADGQFTGTIRAIALDGNDAMAVGGDASTPTTHATATITNAGSAAVAPIITITVSATGILYSIRNTRTGAVLIFNTTLSVGEVVTIDCAAKTITSSMRGNLGSALKIGSSMGRFALLRGTNTIAAYYSGTATISVSHTRRYWSYDG